MKLEQDDRLEAGCVLGHNRFQPPEIVGEVSNPALETVRHLWWRALDRVCGFFVLVRLSIHDRICGPEAPTPPDLKREADHKRFSSGLFAQQVRRSSDRK